MDYQTIMEIKDYLHILWINDNPITPGKNVVYVWGQQSQSGLVKKK